MFQSFRRFWLFVVCSTLALRVLGSTPGETPATGPASEIPAQVLEAAAELPFASLAGVVDAGGAEAAGLTNGPTNPAQDASGILRVQVYSSAGESLAGVGVHILDSEPVSLRLIPEVAESPSAMVSDAEGQLSLEHLLPERPVHLLLTGEGLVPEVVYDVIPAIDSPLTVLLRPTLTLRGWIFDSEGEVVPKAEIRIVDAEGRRGTSPQQTESNAEGWFEIQDLGPDSVDLEVTAAEFRPFRLAAVWPTSDEADELWITLRPGQRFSGTVLDPDGFPVADAAIQLLDPEAGAVGEKRTARTDDEGFFELIGLSPGPRELRADHRDYPSADLEVEVGDDAEVEVRFGEGLLIHGRVLDGTGLPLDRVTVRTSGLGGSRYRGTVATDSEGRFRVGPVTAGTYRLRVEPHGRAPTSRTVELGPEHDADIEVRLEPGATVAGRVRGLDPLTAKARVRATGVGPAHSAVVQSDGSYRLEHLPSGSWILRLDAGGRFAQESLVIEPWAAEQGAEIPLDLHLGAGQTLRGWIQRSGEPLAGAWVSLAAGRFWARVQSARDGSFRFEGLEDGLYQIGVRDAASGLRHRQSLVVDGDSQVFLDLTPTVLRATIRDAATGTGLAGALVDLALQTSAGDLTTVRRRSDAQGLVDLGRLGRGQWRLMADLPGYRAAQVLIELQGQSFEEAELWLEQR